MSFLFIYLTVHCGRLFIIPTVVFVFYFLYISVFYLFKRNAVTFALCCSAHLRVATDHNTSIHNPIPNKSNQNQVQH